MSNIGNWKKRSSKEEIQHATKKQKTSVFKDEQKNINNSQIRFIELKGLTKKSLVQICRRKRWKGYSKYNKVALKNFMFHIQVYQWNAAKTIQQSFRTWLRRIRSYSVVNDTDFLTLDRFKEDAIVFDIRNNKLRIIHRFDPRSLLNSILSTGHFQNPFNRQSITDRDLMRLEQSFHRMPDSKTNPITFRLGRLRMNFTRCISLPSIRERITHERQVERERKRAVEVLTSDIFRVHSDVIEIITEILMPDSEIITMVKFHVIHRHVPRIRSNLINIAAVSRNRSQAIIRALVTRTTRNVRNSFSQLQSEMYLAYLTSLRHISEYLV